MNDTAIFIDANGKEKPRREGRCEQMRVSGNAIFLGRRGKQRVYAQAVDVYWWNGGRGHYDATLGSGKYDRKGAVMHKPGEVVS